MHCALESSRTHWWIPRMRRFMNITDNNAVGFSMPRRAPLSNTSIRSNIIKAETWPVSWHPYTFYIYPISIKENINADFFSLSLWCSFKRITMQIYLCQSIKKNNEKFTIAIFASQNCRDDKMNSSTWRGFTLRPVTTTRYLRFTFQQIKIWHTSFNIYQFFFTLRNIFMSLLLSFLCLY